VYHGKTPEDKSLFFYKQGVSLAIHIKKYLKANKEELYGNSNISP